MHKNRITYKDDRAKFILQLFYMSMDNNRTDTLYMLVRKLEYKIWVYSLYMLVRKLEYKIWVYSGCELKSTSNNSNIILDYMNTKTGMREINSYISQVCSIYDTDVSYWNNYWRKNWLVIEINMDKTTPYKLVPLLTIDKFLYLIGKYSS